MQKLRNFTPHPFTFYAEADCTLDPTGRKQILNEGAEPLFTVQKEPVALTAQMKDIQEGVLQVNGVEIPNIKKVVVSCDPLPALANDEYALVSFIYASAAKQKGWDVSRLRTTDPCYKTMDGFPCGVIKVVEVV